MDNKTDILIYQTEDETQKSMLDWKMKQFG